MEISWSVRYSLAMRSYCIYGVLLLLCAALSGEGKEAKFTIEITPSQNALQPGITVWKKGQPVFFIITMRNHSEHVLHFALTNPAFDYHTTIRDSTGKPVPETENYRRMRERLRNPSGVAVAVTTRNVLVELKPHETQSDTIEISYLYSLSQPGEYTVRLERDLPPEIGVGVAVSNTVRIKVEE